MLQALGFTFCAGAYFSCDGSACAIGERAKIKATAGRF